MKEKPETAMDWILPFRQEDNAAWEKANLFGRICFPFYLFGTACRTIIVWALMLMVIPMIPILFVTESEWAKTFDEWAARIGHSIFCKTRK